MGRQFEAVAKAALLAVATVLIAPSAAPQIGDVSPFNPLQPPIRWQGDMPCGSLFDTPVPRLPNGSPLVQIFGTESIQSHYQLSGGGKIRVTLRQTEKIQVSGARYADAIKDLNSRRPFQDSISRKTSGYTVLADVRYQVGISASSYKLKDGSGYALKPNRIRPSVVAKVRVANWPGYENAAADDRRKWDGHLCESYHHELGHILVAAQIWEEAEPELLTLRGTSSEDVSQKLDVLLDDVGQRIEARQEQYHDEIDAMGHALSRSLPYLDLPFSWLKPEPIGFVQP